MKPGIQLRYVLPFLRLLENTDSPSSVITSATRDSREDPSLSEICQQAFKRLTFQRSKVKSYSEQLSLVNA